MNNLGFLTFVLGLMFVGCNGQSTKETTRQYEIALGGDPTIIDDGFYDMGTHKNAEGGTFNINNFYISQNGKPVILVMGEFQYTRYPKSEWEEGLLKMKASGINAVGFYTLWIHHEEKEGMVVFDKNRDVRYFIQLCQKHGLLAFPRIGPWFHGEARNGGYPEWFVKKMKATGIGSSRYSKVDDFSEAIYKRWFNALGDQFKELYFKDGGPIFAVQLDNEQWADGPGSEGYKYLLDLRKLSEETGMDVPFYTVTGWPGKNLPEKELIPLWGGYPAAPWEGHSNKLQPIDNYLFQSTRLDKQIGSDMGLYKEGLNSETPIYRHPYLTVEMGGGNQITYHRRPRINGDDLLALVYTRLGVGANTIGYYIYHGVQHPLSEDRTYSTQESKEGFYTYPNDYPMISYDFQAPITEWGFTRPYYRDFKLLHMYVNNFGEDLATMYPTLPKKETISKEDSTKLRYAIRSKSDSGYLFFNNHVRHLNMAKHEEVQFSLATQNGDVINIPKESMDINPGIYGIIPFNLNLGSGAILEYATAHPFSIIDNDVQTFFFYAMEGVEPEFRFKKDKIQEINTSFTVDQDETGFTVSGLKPGKDCRISIVTDFGKSIEMVIFTKEQALNTYEFEVGEKEILVLTDGSTIAMYDEASKKLTMKSMGTNTFKVDIYGSTLKGIGSIGGEGGFTSYKVDVPVWEIPQVSFSPMFDEQLKKSWIGYETPKRMPYAHIYNAGDQMADYKISFPATMPKNVSNVLIDLDYQGNTAQLYANGVIIADDFYGGGAMPLGLNRFKDKLGKSEFVLQVSPLTTTENIYFEDEVDLNFTKVAPAKLKDIRLTPEYEVQFELGDK